MMSLLKQRRRNWYKYGGNKKAFLIVPLFSFSAFNVQDEGEETKIADTAPPKKNPAPIKASCHSSGNDMWNVHTFKSIGLAEKRSSSFFRIPNASYNADVRAVKII